METFGIHRPRNVDWKRAAALLYGDWGTSKAYVIGFAFSGAFAIGHYQALPIIVAVCALTGLVAYNYVLVCKHFPDGGGVYSAARNQSRFLAVMGALLLVANFTVTAAMSGWAAMSYFRVPEDYIAWATMGLIFFIGAINFFGPKHSGSLAIYLAAPMVVVVMIIAALCLPHLSAANLEKPPPQFSQNWLAFVGMILALSGVEAIANLTGVMKLDPGATMDQPSVARTARMAIVPVAIEVVLGTALLGWAMLSLSQDLQPLLEQRWEDMLSVLGEQYGTLSFGSGFGKIFGIVVGIVVGLLLLSAVNTAVTALIGLCYMLARDGEMPRTFSRLNAYGVPRWPLAISVLLPVLVVEFANNLESLMGLYAIGVIGAITVNLGSCTFNKALQLRWAERFVMGVTFLILLCVELTVAKTKPDALFFACCVLGVGLGLRNYAQRRAGLRTLTVSEEVAAHVAPEAVPDFQFNLTGGQTILVAARGFTPVLRFALEEAKLRGGSLYVLYVKELAVSLPGPLESTERPRWQDDKIAASIMYRMLELGGKSDVPVVPVYSVSDDPAATILDLSATLGVDMLILGASHRRTMTSLLKGDVVTEVAKNLPENIQLLIHG
ncbi:MAG: amino acid permease [Verrucomicrobia bacterium]|nr:amino acid permease [Verrucomicrobiota bacterium]